MAETTTPKKRGRKAAAAGQPVTQEVVVMVPLAELHPFPDHPFRSGMTNPCGKPQQA